MKIKKNSLKSKKMHFFPWLVLTILNKCSNLLTSEQETGSQEAMKPDTVRVDPIPERIFQDAGESADFGSTSSMKLSQPRRRSLRYSPGLRTT